MPRDEYLHQLEEAIANDELDDDAIDAMVLMADKMPTDETDKKQPVDK